MFDFRNVSDGFDEVNCNNEQSLRLLPQPLTWPSVTVVFDISTHVNVPMKKRFEPCFGPLQGARRDVARGRWSAVLSSSCQQLLVDASSSLFLRRMAWEHEISHQ